MSVISAFKIRKYDLQPYYYAQVKDSSGTVVDISGLSIVCTMKHVDTGTLAVNRGACAIDDGSEGKFHYVWQSGETTVVGQYYIEFEIPDSGGKYTVPPDNSAIVIITGDLDDQ